MAGRHAHAHADGAESREAALRRDAWARWRQLYQSRLMQQRFAVRLVERYFERWKDRLRNVDAMKGRADHVVVAREGKTVVRCWDSWVRAVELRSAEREVSERVGPRVVRGSMAFWRQRTCVPAICLLELQIFIDICFLKA